MRYDCDDYAGLFLHDVPLIDVRAPIEFTQGAFPLAQNLPLMNDQERAEVGTCYKRYGQQAAIELGHQRVSGRVKEERIAAWISQCTRFPQGYLYCFRGGMRSHLVQQWLRDAGVDYPLVHGGYKALRQFMLTSLEQAANMPMLMIGGNTGCGKTLLIKSLVNGVDLEGAACHRGSSFGRQLSGQSNQINFEHRLAITLLKKRMQGVRHWIVEDEGKMIGSNHLPPDFYQSMQQAPLIVIDDPMEIRLTRLVDEYIRHMREDFLAAYGEEQGWLEYQNYLHHGLFAIRRRLGNVRWRTLDKELTLAIEQQKQTHNDHVHLSWLLPLLREYYDPMYSYQLEKKQARLIFRGTYHQVAEFIGAYQDGQ